MAVIQINTFGGEVPSASDRAIPAGAARVSKDLYARTTEFRPAATDVAVAVSALTNPKTLYRMERKADGALNTDLSTGWLTYAGAMSHVRGQVADDNTGRTYYTFDDGSAPPRVMDAVSVNKQLGIPAPAKPRINAIIGDEFTQEDYDKLIRVKKAEIATVARACLGYSPIGYDMTGTPGYISKAASGVIVSSALTGGTTTTVSDPSNPATTQPSTTTTGGTVTTTTEGFSTVGGLTNSTLEEHIALTLQHAVSLSGIGNLGGLVAQVPVAGGGATGFIRLWEYRTFTWDGFTYDTKQFYEWMKAEGLQYIAPKG